MARQGVRYCCPGPTRSTAALAQTAKIKNAQMRCRTVTEPLRRPVPRLNKPACCSLLFWRTSITVIDPAYTRQSQRDYAPKSPLPGFPFCHPVSIDCTSTRLRRSVFILSIPSDSGTQERGPALLRPGTENPEVPRQLPITAISRRAMQSARGGRYEAAPGCRTSVQVLENTQ